MTTELPSENAAMFGRENERPDERPLSPWFVGAVLANDVLTVLTFVWWGLAGQIPLNFALAGAASLMIPIVLVWTSPSPILIGVGCLTGMITGLFIGDAVLGIPINGPVPVGPNLMFHRMLGPLSGSALAGTAALLVSHLRCHESK